MATTLNKSGFEHAEQLINKGCSVADERDDWSEHQPSTAEENKFIQEHGMGEFGKWHLGIDDEHDEQTKRRYKFPYRHFKNVHCCAVIPRRAEPVNTSITTWKKQRRICTE